MKKFKTSFSYATEGLIYSYKTQRNFRIQILAALITMFLALILGFSRFEWIILLILIGLVLSAELANTAVEMLVDLISPALNEKAKYAKDIAAGSVLLISAISFLVGLFLFIPHMLNFLQ